MQQAQTPADGELLYGIVAIARALGITPRRALYLTAKGAIPFWKIDRTICARRSTLLTWLEESERAGLQVKQ